MSSQVHNLQYGEVSLTLVGFPSGAVKAIQQHGRGYFCISHETTPSALVLIWDPHLFFSRDTGIISFRDEQRPDVIVNVYKNNSTQELHISTYEPTRHHGKMLTRVIRAIVMARMQQNGWNFLHAAAVGKKGRCIAIAGEKFQGKTSLMLNCLEHTSLLPTTNDKLAILRHNGHINACGFPVSAGVREGTLRLFQAINNRLSCVPRCKDGDKSIRLEMSALAALYSRPILSSGILAGIIFPKKGTSLKAPRLTQLSEEEGNSLTRSALLHTFSDIDPSQFKISQFFDFYQESKNPDLIEVPKYQIEYSETSAPEAATLISDLLSTNAL